MTDVALLTRLERFYDAVPRAVCDVETVGPFTLFVAREGWPYYARPTLGSDASFTPADVKAVLDRQRELDVPRQLEWVHETTPSLLASAREVGMRVEQCVLMVLPGPLARVTADRFLVRMLDPTDPGFGAARAAVDAGFHERDRLEVEPVVATIAARVKDGLMRVCGGFDVDGNAIGGGSYAPRDGVAELTGIAVVPAWRRRGVGAILTVALADDARALGVTTVFLSAGSESVARVYERAGFTRVGMACIAGHE